MKKQQYATNDNNLLNCILKKLEAYKVASYHHFMLCMTTCELWHTIPTLVTVLNTDVTLDAEDEDIFHEQYRRVYDSHDSIWFIITKTTEQYNFIRKALPIGHSVYVKKADPDESLDSLAITVTDFLFKLESDRNIDKIGSIEAIFKIDIATCAECSQSVRIVSGIRLLKHKDIFNEDTANERTEVFVQAKDFSCTLRRNAAKIINASMINDQYVCPWCKSQLQISIPGIIPETVTVFIFTADDCLRYFCTHD